MIPGIENRILPARIICLLPLFIFCSLRASNDNYPVGSRAAAMSNVGVMCPDFWSVWHNQAGLGFYPHLSVGLHHENRFLVPEFALNSVGITLPTSGGTFAVSWSHFGYAGYHEDKVGLALGKAFGQGFSAGLQIDYLNTFIGEGYGNSGTVAIEAGIMAEPTDNLLIGFHVFNPTASTLPGVNHERIPVILRMGLSYRFDDHLFLGVETEKDLDIEKAIYKIGGEYRLIEYIYIRCGLSVQEYVQHSFGVGFNKYNFQVDLAFSFQQIAGYTPYLSLRYVFK